MNSFNHYAFGAVGEWMYRVVAGLEIDPDEPGYKHVIAQPRPGGGLTSTKARVQTPYGEAASGWVPGRWKVDSVGRRTPERTRHGPSACGGVGRCRGGSTAIGLRPRGEASGAGGQRRRGRGGLGPVFLRLRSRSVLSR
jgi:Bacterial alpha-L-rhamnosidase C-terminal domain